jgi:hypothetical protein
LLKEGIMKLGKNILLAGFFLMIFGAFEVVCSEKPLTTIDRITCWFNYWWTNPSQARYGQNCQYFVNALADHDFKGVRYAIEHLNFRECIDSPIACADPEGLSPLQLALGHFNGCNLESDKIIEYLIMHGARNIPNNITLTPSQKSLLTLCKKNALMVPARGIDSGLKGQQPDVQKLIYSFLDLNMSPESIDEVRVRASAFNHLQNSKRVVLLGAALKNGNSKEFERLSGLTPRGMQQQP